MACYYMLDKQGMLAFQYIMNGLSTLTQTDMSFAGSMPACNLGNVHRAVQGTTDMQLTYTPKPGQGTSDIHSQARPGYN